MRLQKILLVDDDREDRAILQEAMQVIHPEEIILFAQNGVEALSLLQNLYLANELPCLIVLDLNMPKMNGTQTLKALKIDPRFKDISVIIYSTSINPLEKEKCMQLGAHSYITKPVSFRESMETAQTFFQFCNTIHAGS